MAKITNVITLKQYADKYNLDVKRLRRIARKNEFPGRSTPFKFGDTNGRGGVWAIDATAPAVVLPAKSQRGNRRTDGRQRHIVYANAVELAAVVGIVGNANVIDPRVAAKTRRDAKTASGGDTELHGVPMTELPDGTLVVKTGNDANA